MVKKDASQHLEIIYFNFNEKKSLFVESKNVKAKLHLVYMIGLSEYVELNILAEGKPFKLIQGKHSGWSIDKMRELVRLVK